MEIILDSTLEPIKPSYNYGEEKKYSLDGVLEATISPAKTNPKDWQALEGIQPIKTVHTIPDADLYHSSYLEYLSETYASHSGFVMSPDILWYTILCEIASHIKAHPETYRTLFTKSLVKEDILVPGSDCFNLPIEDIKEKLLDLVPVDVDLFLPKFTTTTEMATVSMLAAFLETVSPYYSYSMYMCGHPRVKILGIMEDWDLLEHYLIQLKAEFTPESVFTRAGIAHLMTSNDSSISSWLYNMLNLVKEIKKSLMNGDGDFWKKIFTEERCGSGGQVEISGWFLNIFMNQPGSPRFIHNFPTHISRVPYKVVEMPTCNFELCCGLFSSTEKDGYMIPEFSTVVNQYSENS